MRISYPANSPYFSTPQLSWRMGRFAYRPILPNPNDTRMILNIRHQYRPDKLSQELYGKPAFWWIFCARNPFLRANPIWDFVTGLEIIVPAQSMLHQILGA